MSGQPAPVYRASPSLLRVAFGLFLGFLGHYAVSSIYFSNIADGGKMPKLPVTVIVPSYWNENIQAHFTPLVALWLFAFFVAVVLRLLKRESLDFEERVYEWAIFGLTFVSSICTIASAPNVLSSHQISDFSTSVSTRRADRAVLLWAYLALIFNYCLIWYQWYSLYIIFVPVFMFLLIPFRMELTGETKGFLKATSLIHWGLMSCVFSLSHNAYLVLLPVFNIPGGPAGNLVFLVTVSEAADLSHWYWSKLLNKFAPWTIVSYSSRTWIGAFGALVTCTGIAYYSTPTLTMFTRMQGTVLGFLIAVGSLAGGIFLSCLKRSLAPKGEAGSFSQRNVALVRAFSLIFVAPVFFHWIRYSYT